MENETCKKSLCSGDPNLFRMGKCHECPCFLLQVRTTLIEDNRGTITATIVNSGLNFDEVCVEAEYEPKEKGDFYNADRPARCEITRVFIDVSEEYGEENLDMGRLHKHLSRWESILIKMMEGEEDGCHVN